MNWYPEVIESGTGNAPIVLYPTPGLQLIASLTIGGAATKQTRGIFSITGRTFVIADTGLFELLSNGTTVPRGTVLDDANPVTFAASPQQMLIASAGTAYVYDLMTNTLNALPGATFSGPVAQAGICDDFFLLTIKNSKTFYVSAPLDANDWVTNGSAIVSVFPDNIVSMSVFQRQIWFFSDTQSVVYYDSGNIFPFDVNPNAFIEAGCAAENSVAQMNNALFWLGADARGHGKVWMASGYTPTRVSNHAIEFAIQGYSRIDDAVAFTYQDQGHEFYVLYFPTPSVTWVYDAATGMWHQRGFFVETIGQFRAAHYWNHTFNFGKHLVGDWNSGNLYEMHIPIEWQGVWSFADDLSNPIVRIRRAPHISQEQQRLFFSELQVYIESGLGPMPPLQGPKQQTNLILIDSALQKWQVAINDFGVITATSVPSGFVNTVTLNALNNTSWRLGITTLGVLTLTSTTFTPSGQSFFVLNSISGNSSWAMGTTNLGALTTSKSANFSTARGPQMNLRWSKDGGHTWSNYHARDCGQAGEYKKRLRWLRLGRARDMVFEISCSDPIGYRVIDGYVKMQPGTGA